MWTVYKHTNIANGKVYIGITSQDPQRRWRCDGSGYKKCLLFYRAIEKYGWENFLHEILSSGLSKKEAEKLEKKLIKDYRANDKNYGYNISKGGSVNSISEETKEKIRNTLKANYVKENHPNYGKKFSDETKKKLSAAHTGKYTGKKHPNYGKQMSEEQKKKISETLKAKKIAPNMDALKKATKAVMKSVIQMNDKKEVIAIYESAASASRATGINKCSIGKSCRSGGVVKAGEFFWEFEQKEGAYGNH